MLLLIKVWVVHIIILLFVLIVLLLIKHQNSKMLNKSLLLLVNGNNQLDGLKKSMQHILLWDQHIMLLVNGLSLTMLINYNLQKLPQVLLLEEMLMPLNLPVSVLPLLISLLKLTNQLLFSYKCNKLQKLLKLMLNYLLPLPLLLPMLLKLLWMPLIMLLLLKQIKLLLYKLHLMLLSQLLIINGPL